ncbi:hypothetical protein PIB30_071818 [Stylosanthes scabra]|uniref:Uncharacterized protein n=1 Tax=Stylosanthes scabra TaxID=79078 RepID=A0ABU6UMN0_9FABA|nr:hypothetical protein [Stylosanthes scabra]
MRGEDVRAEDIIADKIVRMAQGIKEKGKRGFPSTIYKLCKEAGVPLRELRRTKKIQAEKPITARRMESTRLPRPVQQRQQEDEEEDHPMPQAGEGNEEGNEEEQGYDHDYHHQHDFEQQQPEFEHHQDFNEEPPVQQLPLYHVPNYTDQHQEDLHSIETQLQNMMWYQQQSETRAEGDGPRDSTNQELPGSSNLDRLNKAQGLFRRASSNQNQARGVLL